METLPEPDLSRLHTRLVPRNGGRPPAIEVRRSRKRDERAAFGGLVAGVATVASAIGGVILGETPAEAVVISVAVAGIAVGVGAAIGILGGIWDRPRP